MDRLISLYKSLYSCDPESCAPLTGSASNRKYYRLSAGHATCVGVIGTDTRENNAFVVLARHLADKGVNVPGILAVSKDGMAYLQQDLGGDVLYEKMTSARRKGEGMEEVESLLCRTMAELPKIQFKGAEDLDFSICYPQPSFDLRMVMFDLNYFKYCFLKPSGLEFDEAALQDEFERFAADLLQDDMDAFMYRDFNARNVMVHDGAPYFIDFQGGRRGPVYYDVASFIWQARAAYPDALRSRMLDCYLEALSEYMPLDKGQFMERLQLFILFRLLQVLGAYGFRGLVEQKSAFVTAIPAAMGELARLPEALGKRYPYLMEVVHKLAELPRFNPVTSEDGVLEVKVCSFSFKKGLPYDPTGNGGGYVFDCRSIHNPGRYEPYKKLTGRDEPVIRFLEEDGEVFSFLDHVYGVVDPHVETYSGRGFTSLMVSFGCTGGQHRSVYCAEHLAAHLTQKYHHIRVTLTHREHPLKR